LIYAGASIVILIFLLLKNALPAGRVLKVESSLIATILL
jgi:hypothetical protein